MSGLTGPEQRGPGYLRRRRERIVAEVQRNRRGEYRVPTWMLVLALVAVLGGVAALVLLAG